MVHLVSQDLSIAGKRAGLEGERSGLFMEQIRLIKEMRDESFRRLRSTGADVDRRLVKPRFMVWENVPGTFSSNKGDDFRVVLEETARVADKTAVIPGPPKGKWSTSGCIMGDGWSIAWRVHDAQFWGVPQRRRRIALVADFAGGAAPEVLFERESVSGHSETCRETRKSSSKNVKSGINKTSKCLNAWDVQSKHIQPENGIAEALYAGECRYSGGESYILQKEKVYCLQGNGIDRADTAGCNGKGWREDKCYTLNTIDRPAVLAIENHPMDSRVKVSEDGIVQTLNGRMGTGGGNVPMIMEEPILLESNQNHATIQTNGISTSLPASMGMGGGYVPMVVQKDDGEN